MQTDAYSHQHPMRPGIRSKSSLGLHRRDGITGTSKDDEEAISLCIDFVTLMLLERCAQQVTPRGKHIRIALTQELEEARGPLDVGEEQGDGSCWEFTRAAPRDT